MATAGIGPSTTPAEWAAEGRTLGRGAARRVWSVPNVLCDIALPVVDVPIPWQMLLSQTTGFTRMFPVATGGSPGHQAFGPPGGVSASAIPADKPIPATATPADSSRPGNDPLQAAGGVDGVSFVHWLLLLVVGHRRALGATSCCFQRAGPRLDATWRFGGHCSQIFLRRSECRVRLLGELIERFVGLCGSADLPQSGPLFVGAEVGAVGACGSPAITQACCWSARRSRVLAGPSHALIAPTCL